MPINPYLIPGLPSPDYCRLDALKYRVMRLALDAQRCADQMVAEPMDEYEAEAYLGPAATMIAWVRDTLEDGLYSATVGDQSHRRTDLAMFRAIADAASEDPLASPPR